MAEILGLDTLVAQMILALGAALVLGNGFAYLKFRRGEKPKGVEGEFRPGRVRFLIVVGLVLAVWGAGSLLAG